MTKTAQKGATAALPLNTILSGDCVEVMNSLPDSWMPNSNIAKPNE